MEADHFEDYRRASREYLARSPDHDGKVTLFRATERPEIHGRSYSDPFNAWGDSARSVEVHSILGAHHDLFVEPALNGLARALEDCL